MRTAGLKSISAKHLALAAQSLAALLAALPLLRWQLAAAISDPARRALMMPEFDRLAQDLNLHVEEIHGKLVDIMQDRVLAACRQVSVDSDAWSRADPSLQARQVAQPAPSEALKLLARQLNTLRSVLQPILQPEEVSYIFGRVAAACSESLAGLLDSLPPPAVAAAPASAAALTPSVSSGASGLLRGFGGGVAAAAAAAAAAAEAQALAMAAWEASRRANALFMLQALSTLPLDPSRASSYVTRLATFYTKHYGLLQPPTAAATATEAALQPPPPPPPPPLLQHPFPTDASPPPSAAAPGGTGAVSLDTPASGMTSSPPPQSALLVSETRLPMPPEPEREGPANGRPEGSAASRGIGESAAAVTSIISSSPSNDAAPSSSSSSSSLPLTPSHLQPQPPVAATTSVVMDGRPGEDVGSSSCIPTPPTSPLSLQQDQGPKDGGG
ncbi:hypothetical protein Vafri_18922, partial [Volvox africanus]